jgi:hypothetical protein
MDLSSIPDLTKHQSPNGNEAFTVRSATRAERDAILAWGEPFIVAAREVAKVMQPFYPSDPETILGCIIVSGTLDTAVVLRAQQHFNHGMEISEEELFAHMMFDLVWREPTEEQRKAVLRWAEKIRAGRPKRQQRYPLTWQ